MKKICGLILLIISFHAHYGMETWGTVKDALLGNPKKPRNLKQEINEARQDDSLTEPAKSRKLASLYTELRNRHRGTELYDEYNAIACSYRERATRIENAQKEEENLTEQIRTIRQDTLRKYPERLDEIIIHYEKLTNLFAGIDEEQHQAYNTRLTNHKAKKSYLQTLALYRASTDKTEQVTLLRKLSEQCAKENPDRAQEHMRNAERLEQEIQQEERAAKYKEIENKILETADLSQKAKLYRVLAYYSDQGTEENLAIAKQLEEQAEKQQQEHLIVVGKVARIVGLSIEISKVDNDKKLPPFEKCTILSQLLQQRRDLSHGIPKYESEFENDLTRIQKLQREALGYASTDAERQSVIALIKY